MSDQSAYGRIGAHVRWASTANRTAATQPARDALMQKFEDEVDPDRVLPVAERALRAASARKAYFQRLALKSAQSRRAKRSA